MTALCLIATLIVASVVSSVFGTMATRRANDASIAKQSANQAKADAETSESEKNARLQRYLIDEGFKLVRAGDHLSALIRFVEALRLEPKGEAAESTHRLRIGTLQAHMPSLQQAWFLPSVRYAEFNHDASQVVISTGTRSGKVGIWDVRSGALVGREMQHPNAVYLATLAPGGATILTLCSDRQVRLWDVTSSELVHTVPVGEHIYSCEFSPLGDRFIAACHDNQARLFSTETGLPIDPPLAHDQPVVRAVFNHDGRRIATLCRDGSIRLWDAQTGEQIGDPFAPNPSARVARFSADGTWIATAGRRVHLSSTQPTGDQHELLDPRGVREASERSDSYRSIAFSADGRFVVAGHEAGFARVWRTSDGQPWGPILAHDRSVLACDFHHAGELVATGSGDLNGFEGEARVWEANSGNPLTPPLIHSEMVERVQFDNTGTRLLTVATNASVRVWNVERRSSTTRFFGHENDDTELPPQLMHAVVSPDCSRIVTCGRDHTSRLWSYSSGRLVADPLTHSDVVWMAAFAPDSQSFVTTCKDGSVRLWNAENGQLLSRLDGHEEQVVHAEFSSDGLWMATASYDDTVRIWSLPTNGTPAHQLPHPGDVMHARFSPDGTRLVTSCSDGKARVWAVNSGKLVSDAIEHRQMIRFADFDRSGRLIVSCSQDQTARVWDARSFQPLTPPMEHRHVVGRAVFSHDGQWVATASWDGTARIWNTVDGSPISKPMNHDLRLMNIDLSPNGQLLATACADGTARVWDVDTGLPITEPLRQRGHLTSAVFASDAELLTTGAYAARTWSLVGDKRPMDDLIRLAEIYSRRRVDDTGAFVTLSRDDLRERWTMWKRTAESK